MPEDADDLPARRRRPRLCHRRLEAIPVRQPTDNGGIVDDGIDHLDLLAGVVPEIQPLELGLAEVLTPGNKKLPDIRRRRRRQDGKRTNNCEPVHSVTTSTNNWN